MWAGSIRQLLLTLVTDKALRTILIPPLYSKHSNLGILCFT